MLAASDRYISLDEVNLDATEVGDRSTWFSSDDGLHGVHRVGALVDPNPPRLAQLVR